MAGPPRLPATIHRGALRRTVAVLSLSYRLPWAAPPFGFRPLTTRGASRTGQPSFLRTAIPVWPVTPRSSGDGGDGGLAAQVDLVRREEGDGPPVFGKAEQAVTDDGRRDRPRQLPALASPQIYDQQGAPGTSVRMGRCPCGEESTAIVYLALDLGVTATQRSHLNPARRPCNGAKRYQGPRWQRR
jgi:hypothetical protein